MRNLQHNIVIITFIYKIQLAKYIPVKPSQLMYSTGSVTKFFFKLFCRESSLESFVVWIEHGVGTQSAVGCWTRPCVCVDDVQRRYDKVNCAKFQLDEQTPQDEPQDNFEERRMKQ